MSAGTDTGKKGGGGGKTFAIILAGFGSLIGVLFALGGLGLIAVHVLARDDDGYYTTHTERLASARYAVATDAIDLGRDSVDVDAGDLGASLEVTATSVAGKPIFVGIGHRADVARYLRGVGYSRLDDFGDGRPRYSQVPGRRPRSLPTAESFWAAKSAGRGEQRAEWDVEPGTWTAVVMNADASRAVAVEADAGVRISWLIWVGMGLLVVGALIAGLCIYAVRNMTRPRAPTPTPGADNPAVPPTEGAS